MIIRCIECSTEYSDRAECCPKCSCPTESQDGAEIVVHNNTVKGKQSKESESESNVRTESDKSKMVLINEVIEAYILQMSKTTVDYIIKQKRSDLKNTFSACHIKKLTDITMGNISNFVNALESSKRISLVITIKQFMDWILKNGYMANDPLSSWNAYYSPDSISKRRNVENSIVIVSILIIGVIMLYVNSNKNTQETILRLVMSIGSLLVSLGVIYAIVRVIKKAWKS